MGTVTVTTAALSEVEENYFINENGQLERQTGTDGAAYIADRSNYTPSPILVRLESGITTTRKRLTFSADEKIKRIIVIPYYNSSTLVTTDAHDEQDMMLFVVNAPSIATANALLNGGDNTISSPDSHWPVLPAFMRKESEYEEDGDDYITTIDVISADSAGAGPALGVWIGGMQ